MTGDACAPKRDDSTSPENLGLYYMAAQDVFAYAQSAQYRHLTVTVSLFEIYGKGAITHFPPFLLCIHIVVFSISHS